MGRAPCCDKANVKKGPWSPEEDAKLKTYIQHHGTGGNWIALPQKIGLKRCGKSCRLRWLNYLRPNIKHGGFSEEEDNIICSLYVSIGSRWSVIAAQLPGRTDNDIKNYWNTRLKKKLLGKHRKEQQQGRSSGVVVVNKQGISNNNIGDSSSSLLMIPENSTQQPYWPAAVHVPNLLPPVPYTNQLLGPSFNHQDSIRKLVIKLGGRFSHDDDYQPTLDDDDGVVLVSSNNNHQFRPTQEQALVHVGSYSCTNSINGIQYCSEEVQGQAGNFSAGIGEMVSSSANYSQRLFSDHGIEFFYGEEDMVVTDTKTIGTGNWDETSTTIYPLVTPQECVFQPYYPGPQ